MRSQEPKVMIRVMTMKDYAAVLSLWKDGNIPSRPKGRDSKKNIALQLLQPIFYFLVAVSGGKIIGAVVGTHDGRKGWINRLVVASSYKKKGIGRRLVAAVEQYFSTQGIDIVACLIEEWNTISMKVFEQLGYMRHTDIFYYSKRKSPKT